MNENLAWLAQKQSEQAVGGLSNKPKSLVKFSIAFKDKSSYLTNEGWVMGTECWVCWIDVYDRVRIPVCRANIDDCLDEAVSRIKRYFEDDAKCWVGINQDQIDKVFSKTRGTP